MNNNIIRFPVEQRKESIEKEQEEQIEELEHMIDDLVSDVLTFLHEIGYDVDNDDYIQDVSLFFESFRSFIFRMCGVQHPAQQFAEKIFQQHMIYSNPDQISFDFDE